MSRYDQRDDNYRHQSWGHEPCHKCQSLEGEIQHLMGQIHHLERDLADAQREHEPPYFQERDASVWNSAIEAFQREAQIALIKSFVSIDEEMFGLTGNDLQRIARNLRMEGGKEESKTTGHWNEQSGEAEQS